MSAERVREFYRRQGEHRERQRILELIAPHPEVCNYSAVTDNDCDVCHWVLTTIEQINNPNLDVHEAAERASLAMKKVVKNTSEPCGCIWCESYDEPCYACGEAHLDCQNKYIKEQ